MKKLRVFSTVDSRLGVIQGLCDKIETRPSKYPYVRVLIVNFTVCYLLRPLQYTRSYRILMVLVKSLNVLKYKMQRMLFTQ